METNGKRQITFAVLILGANGLLCIVGIVLLQALDKEVPSILHGLAGSMLGALVSLVAIHAPSPFKRGEK